MQQASARHAPYADARRAAVRVKYGLVDVSAAGDTVPLPSEQNTVAQTAQILREAEGMGAKWSTVERDHFRLDGTFALFPDNPAAYHVGWWTARQSDAQGVLSPAPALTFRFSQPHRSIGFTVIFDDLANQYCTDFTIQTYDAAGQPLTQAAVTGNTLADCPVKMYTEGYCTVVFTFTKTNKPFRFVRVSQILFGIVQKHDNHNTASLSLLYELSPTMESAPANELVVTIDNAEHLYNMVNPQGLYRFLQQGQALDVQLAVSARGTPEYINMGRFYFTRARASDASLTAQITANSPFYFMENTTFRKGRQETIKVQAFIAEIFADAGFPLAVRSVGGVGDRLICAHCDLVSHRKAVQLAAQAARCVCLISRDNEVVLAPSSIGAPKDTLTMHEQTEVPGVDIPDRINTISLTVSRLSEGETPETVHESTITVEGATEKWFDYNTPASTVTAAVSGGTLVSAAYYLGAARLVITGSGAVTVSLTGTPLNREETVWTAQQLDIGEGEQLQTVENPLVAPGAEQALADWLLARRREIYLYTVSERGNPAREIGDSVRIFDAYGEHRTALASKIELDFDGTLSGAMEAVGGI